MKYFNGEPVEIVIAPSNLEIEKATKAASHLMAEKIEQWILDRLTIEQLAKCIKQFEDEIKRRLGEA